MRAVKIVNKSMKGCHEDIPYGALGDSRCGMGLSRKEGGVAEKSNAGNANGQ
jgi:hypothetical protein